MLFDTHSHIYLNKQKNIDEIIGLLPNDGIKKIVCIGIDLKTSLKAIEIAKKYPGIVYATVGIHPCDIKQYLGKERETFNKLEHIILENIKYIVGIGETGYDFHWNDKDKFDFEYKNQTIFLEKHIFLAKKFSLPLIIHSRDAKEYILEALKKNEFKKFILHCFSEDLIFAFKSLYYSQECMISFSGIVTYKSAKEIQKTAANIPLKNIIIETDCPYLAPQEVRGSENYPNNLKYILKKIYDLRIENGKQETFEEIEKNIYENSLKIFNLN